MTLTAEQLEILQHSLGAGEYGDYAPMSEQEGRYYRNRFVTSPTGPDGLVCESLVALGLMQCHPPHDMTGGQYWYQVTKDGARIMRENSPSRPKKTRAELRYECYLSWRECTGGTFGAFLRSKAYDITRRTT